MLGQQKQVHLEKIQKQDDLKKHAKEAKINKRSLENKVTALKKQLKNADQNMNLAKKQYDSLTNQTLAVSFLILILMMGIYYK